MQKNSDNLKQVSQSPEKLTDLLEREKITIKETTKKHALIYTLTLSNKLVGHK